MMTRLLIAVVLLSGFSTAAVGDDCVKSMKSRYEGIRTTDVFKDSRVGYAGETPKEVHEFRCILKQPDASKIFSELLSQSRLPGKLYALSGLYLTDRHNFENVVRAHEKNKSEVTAMFGCIVMSIEFAALLKQIQTEGLAQRLAND
jgi:hypothetical protein